MRFALLQLCSPHLTRFSSFWLVTLAVQNAALSIVMHYSCVSLPPSQTYSPASAVLLNEILKGLIVHCCRHPSFQLEGVPLPRVDISVTPARLSGDLLCRLMEILNPRRPLRHPEFLPIRRYQQRPRRYFPSHLSDEDPHNSSLRRPLTQVPFAYKVDGSLFPCPWSRHRSTPIRFGQWSHTQASKYSSGQRP